MAYAFSGSLPHFFVIGMYIVFFVWQINFLSSLSWPVFEQADYILG